CVSCHGPGKARGGLRLDGREAATATLDSGKHAVVPGRPEQSELLRRVSAADKEERMPRGGEPLGAGQVETLRRSIAHGRRCPAPGSTPPPDGPPPPPPPAPLPAGWGRPLIALLILKKLAPHRLPPAPGAARRPLLRRLSFDLVGLPPTPEETDAFVADR